ncbi:MAG: TIGR03792 family protein [Cyanobacteriota bacterium]|nr:TIGR03792 family protein [Cyanobacteriota bacterium]
MVIEWLKFRVEPSKREEFVRKDALVWTATLAHYPGFLGKEVWLDPHNLESTVLIIHWKTREQWKAIPQDILERTEAKMQQAMGDVYEMVESREYQILHFGIMNNE